jgi:hypothetical protein
MFLTNLAVTPALRLRSLPNPAAISEAFDYDRFFEALSSCFLLPSLRTALVAAVRFVISEALDSIPTFDRLLVGASFFSTVPAPAFAVALSAEPSTIARENPYD